MLTLTGNHIIIATKEILAVIIQTWFSDSCQIMILIVIICVQATCATLNDMAFDCDSPNFKAIYMLNVL